MRGKEEKKGRGKEEKKRREKMGTKSQKKKKKNEVCAQSSFFGSIRNMLFREKHTMSTFIFMQDFFDEQIM